MLRARVCWNGSRTRKSVSGSADSARRRGGAGFRQEAGRRRSNQLAESADAKGEYYSYHEEGSRTQDHATFWPRRCPVVIPKIYFPKTMYWTGKGGPRFIRPIRWIVALLGEDIVPFELAGVRSGT